MMNEFIVFWSFDNSETLEHIGYEKLDCDGNYVFKRMNIDTKILRDVWHLGMLTDNQGNAKFYRFPYIGKTDDTPEQNKIYADCSIVEFQYLNGEDVVKANGYFYYCNDNMQYEIDITKGEIESGQYNFNDLMGIKVIGTLQQNKELLENK